MWVLIIVFYYGQVVTLQEFTTKERCESTAQYIVENGNKGALKTYTCMEK